MATDRRTPGRPYVEEFMDQRTREQTQHFGLSLTEEELERTIYDMLRDMQRNMSGVTDHIGNTLSRTSAHAIFRAWAELTVGGAYNGASALSFNRSDPCHVIGAILLFYRERDRGLWEALCNIDPACDVRLEFTRDVQHYSVEAHILVRIPHMLAYRRGAVVVQPERISYTQPDDPFLHFRQDPTATRSRPEMDEEIAQAIASALSTPPVAAAPEKPQGDLTPRKTKRISVATPTPGPEAESPRRLKLRRSREN